MKKKQTTDAMDCKDRDWDFRKIMKDIEFLGASHMSWKERKDLENRKPPKKQRLPLSVARVQMKKQKEREEKMLQEKIVLGRFGSKVVGGAKRSMEKHKPEKGLLRSSEGYFRNGVLDVKHMLNAAPSKDNDSNYHMGGKGKKKKNKGSRKKNQGKKKGSGRKSH
ncbi:uncharacterized protein LOC110607436 isoform X2 [Manihot esculenta]|uniref:Uncharacterized protein n=3 Tax=Manihot esculenta TaxID=3983 RepID=A0ACB7HA65_MANES|nr:uncharacterized protein LOC110607436 isoform X2 [Manihot esculenta]KAG8649140.1 hypothetical protein MANES_08G069866v8 [Manihot esculenta]KAG8649141.1 hypothetical protein MANES_08G069866v8 [Manihot esculenta]